MDSQVSVPGNATEFDIVLCNQDNDGKLTSSAPRNQIPPRSDLCPRGKHDFCSFFFAVQQLQCPHLEGIVFLVCLRSKET